MRALIEISAWTLIIRPRIYEKSSTVLSTWLTIIPTKITPRKLFLSLGTLNHDDITEIFEGILIHSSLQMDYRRELGFLNGEALFIETKSCVARIEQLFVSAESRIILNFENLYDPCHMSLECNVPS